MYTLLGFIFKALPQNILTWGGQLWYTDALRLQYTFRSAIFFKFGFLVQTNGRRVISNFWEQNWKKPNIGGEMDVLRYGRK